MVERYATKGNTHIETQLIVGLVARPLNRLLFYSLQGVGLIRNQLLIVYSHRSIFKFGAKIKNKIEIPSERNRIFPEALKMTKDSA